MDKFNPIISIIFPSFNGERYLYRNLNSIRNLNNLEEIELIIIDNNSRDSSIEIINSFKKIKITLIKQKNNVGFAKACNIGVVNAKGKFIFITNQDVIFPPDFFIKLLKIYKNYTKNFEIILSPALLFEMDGVNYFGAKIHFLGFSYTTEMNKKLLKKKIMKITQKISGCTIFMKKKLFHKLGKFDNLFFMYHEDTDLSLRALRYGYQIYTTNYTYLIHQKHSMALNNYHYYLIERNRYIIFIKNIDNFKKLIPFFFLSEIILLFHSILTKKFKIRIKIYYEILCKIKFFKDLRKKSRRQVNLFPYQKLSKILDPILLENFKNIKILKTFLSMFNILLKLI